MPEGHLMTEHCETPLFDSDLVYYTPDIVTIVKFEHSTVVCPD